jgi:hypothetical protein
MSQRIIIQAGMPPIAEAKVRRICMELESLLPPRFEKVTVTFNRQPSAAVHENRIMAHAIGEAEYCQGSITLYPRFFLIPLEEMRLTFIHELLHVITWEFTEAAEEALQSGLDQDAALLEYATKNLRRERERVVDALAYGIERLLTEAEAKRDRCTSERGH